MKRITWLGILLILISALQACAVTPAPQAAPVQQPTAAPTAVKAQAVLPVIGNLQPTDEKSDAAEVTPTPAADKKWLIEEDFSVNNGKWDYLYQDDKEGSLAIEDGALHFINLQKDIFTLSPYLTDENLDNAALSVDVKIGSTADGVNYGFICRYVDDKNYYLLRADDTAYFSIRKLADDKFLDLIKWSPSKDIPKDHSEVVHLEASCIDDTFTFSVNGKLIGKVTDKNVVKSGKVGLVSGLNADAKAVKGDVSFMNFKVSLP